MEKTECSETSAYKIQTPGNYPKESIQQATAYLLTATEILHPRNIADNRWMPTESLTYRFPPSLSNTIVTDYDDTYSFRLRLKSDDTRAETRFCLSAKRTSPFNRQGRQFSRLLAAEVWASEVVILDTPSSEVVKDTGYPLHSPVSPSLPLPCVTLFHQVSTGLY